MNNDSFINPQPPSNYVHPVSRDDNSHLTNDDFRKLLMTPSASTVNRDRVSQTPKVELSSTKKKFANEASERRKEKKLYYASLVKESKEREAELAQKYRDRAKERREHTKTVDTEIPNSTPNNSTANFRTVPPDFNLTDNADRRRQIIEESKYLGGDLEHTHLVKGLDYALLHKIKAELDKNEVGEEEQVEESKEKEDDEKQSEDEEDEQEEKIRISLKPKIASKASTAAIAAAFARGSLSIPKKGNRKSEEAKKGQAKKKEDEESDEDESKLRFKTKLGRNVYRVLFESKPPRCNELFLPHRMAYIVELNEEEVDVPITSVRSKADCPSSETNTSLTTNDIVINKLTQILSYLRHGKRDAKKSKKKTNKPDEASSAQNKSEPTQNIGIYDDVGDYVPDLSKKEEARKEDALRQKKAYFAGEKEKEEFLQAPTKEAAQEFIKNINEKYSNKEIEPKKEEKEKKSGLGFKFDPDSYAECYPGTTAEEDVNIDSDEEADFSKMDLGNKKGPVNRWDFDSNEEYSNYMSNREALPKAAFQYGLKMADGRKTRRLPGDAKNEKAKIDKEWTQISRIIEKRKQGEYDSGYKKPKY